MVDTVGDKIHDATVRHSVYLLRYGRSVYRQHSKLIDQAVSDLSYQLSRRSPSDNTFTKARLQAMLESTKEVSRDLFSSLSDAVEGDLKGLAAYESEIQIAMIQNAYPIEMALTTVTPSAIHAAAMSRPFQGRLLKDWFKDQSYGIQQQFKAAVKLGFVEGESIPQIVGRVRDVGDMTRRQSEAIIRTAVSHVAQVARDKTTEANTEIFKGEEWVSTLDGRTTAVCRARDGEVYQIGKGPKVPAHIGCRSARIPITKSWEELGLGDLDEFDALDERPFVADKRSVKDIPKDKRDAVTGRTTIKSYNEWLRTQSRVFVEDVLGKKKAALYLDGGLSLDRFVDRKGVEYTLDELAIKELKAFEKAGL